MKMTQLTKGMFGTESEPTSDAFGLQCGQTRAFVDRLARNNGWYNRAGEKLGWGDLSTSDLQRLTAELNEGEFFLTLREGDSFKNFVVASPGPTHRSSDTRPESEAPGIDYVLEHVHFIVAHNALYWVDRFGTGIDDFDRKGLTFKLLSPQETRSLVLGG